MNAEPPSSPWYDALLILRRATPGGDVRWLIEGVDPGYMATRSHRLVEWTRLGNDRVEVSVHADVALLPRIERTEVWLYAAAGLWFNRQYTPDQFSQPRDAFIGLCERIGCCPTNNLDIRERWRTMDYKQPLHTLPLSIYEDRPVCKLCKGIVASKAGHTYESGAYRGDLHDECARYVHRILIPARQEQLEAEARK